MEVGFSRIIDFPFDTAIEKVTAELKKEGFGVLTTIDVQDTLKKKIGAEFRRFTILGACNPILAHKALSAEEQVALLLPCNVVVSEEQNNTTKISILDPDLMNKLIDSPIISAFAEEVKDKLSRVLKSI